MHFKVKFEQIYCCEEISFRTNFAVDLCVHPLPRRDDVTFAKKLVLLNTVSKHKNHCMSMYIGTTLKDFIKCMLFLVRRTVALILSDYF